MSDTNSNANLNLTNHNQPESQPKVTVNGTNPGPTTPVPAPEPPSRLKTRLTYILGSVALFLAAFIMGIFFTIYMTTHAFDNGPLKEIQRPILTASGIPADAHVQWLDLEGTFANIDRYFYGRDKIDHQKMLWSAADAAAHVLGDPFTRFSPPEQTRNEQDALVARRLGGGLGFYAAIQNNHYLVNQLIPGNAAEKAGVQEGDIILKINDTPVTISGDAAKDLDATSKQLRGEIGSQVKLSLQRPKENDRIFEITVTRADVVIPTVMTRLVGENKDVGYINVTTFGPETLRQFDEKVGELEKSNVSSYVLDLRGNGGGLVDVAQKLIGRFIEGGVAYYRNVPYQNLFNEPQNVINEQNGLHLYNKPLVVLINGGTASASEITAGALQDRNRAPLIGEKSFGKGVAQLVLPLPSNASVRVTFEQWLTPNKSNLSETKGIRPNIELVNKPEDTNAGRDPQLQRALDFLKNKETAPAPPPPPAPASTDPNK